MMSLLGIDIGSGSCKGVAFAVDGRVLAQADAAYHPVSHGGGMVEIDAECFWTAASDVIRRIAAAVPHDPIAAMAISSHGETFVAVGRNGRSVAPALMNSDNRAAAQVDWWRENVGAERIYELTGLPLHAMFALNKIMWFKANRPELYARSVRFLSVGDYILLRLGMPFVTDYSLAGRTMAFDIHKKTWSAELLAAAGIGPEYFPEVMPAGHKVGTLSHRMAAELGLPDGVVVALGGHDQPCGALGAGAIDPGQVAVAAGTYECATAVSDRPVNTPLAFGYSLNSYCHVVPDRYVTLAFFPAGIAARWFTEQFGGEDRMAAEREHRPFYDVFNERTQATCPGPSGICFTPHLIGACNPYWDVRATGTVAGITPDKTRYHLYKAILEGIACELALNVNALEEVVGTFDVMTISGGNAKADFAVQLRADLTGKTILSRHTAECVCQGAALLAGIAAGIYADASDAVGQTMRRGKVFAPDSEVRKAYARQYEQYQTLYRALAPVRAL